MESLRRLFSSTGGKIASLILILIGVVCVYLSIKSNLGPNDGALLARSRMFVCSQTGKSFQHDLSDGEVFPVKSPFSGTNTGYPGEACYWTKEGTPKDEPDWVLLNSWTNTPGPTFCPYCGRLVVPHNPVPRAGSRPPPTQAEYMARMRGDLR
jgi:hypothetical protein